MKKGLSVLLALLLFLSLIPSSDGIGFLPGDIIIFGRYEQDNNPANGREPIEWIVLDVQGEKALLISAAVLDTQAYHNSLEDISWEDCTIRSWLNYYFLNTAFTAAEQKQILTTAVSSDKNPRNSTDPGNITKDKVFLLSYHEAENYFSSDADRQCAATVYAKSQAGYNGNLEEETCSWWLRSPSYAQFLTNWVDNEGKMKEEGLQVTSEGIGVRPAIWVSPGSSLQNTQHEKDSSEHYFGDYRYTVLGDGTAEIVKYTGKSTDVIIPKELNGRTVTSIGDGAFFRCGSVKSVVIPGSITNIGEGVFGGDSELNSIIVSPDNPALETKDGVLFSKADKRLVYCPGREAETYVIPDGTQIIGDNAFLNYNCRSLKEIIIPDSVKTIGNSSFSNCRNLLSIEIPEHVTSIGDRAFDSCNDLVRVKLPASLTYIGDAAFAFCYDLENISIPENVETVGNAVFKGCSEINIELADNHRYLEVIDGVLFSKTDKRLIWCPDSLYGTYQIPDGTKIIGAEAFWHCERLRNIEFPDTLEEIQELAFSYCKKITKFVLTERVRELGEYVFEGCSGLSEITVTADNPYFYVRDGILFQQDEEKLVYCLRNASGIITVPDGIQIIGSYAFSGCQDITRVYMPDSITTIEEAAFHGCTKLTRLKLSSNLTAIGDWAFSMCGRLMEIELPQRLKTIGSYAFSGCERLSEIQLPDGVEELGDNVFDCCTGLERIRLPDSIQSIGEYAFNYCIGLKKAILPAHITALPSGIFDDCYSLKDVAIPDSVVAIGSSAFSYCKSLTNVVIPDNVISISDNAFANCPDIRLVVNDGSYAKAYCERNGIDYALE